MKFAWVPAKPSPWALAKPAENRRIIMIFKLKIRNLFFSIALHPFIL